MQRTQPVGQIRRVESDGQRFAREFDGQVFLRTTNVVGPRRQLERSVGELHPNLCTAVRHQRDALDRLGQFGDGDRGDSSVFSRKQLTKFRKLGIEQSRRAALAVAADSEQSFLADGRPCAQRQVHIAGARTGLRGFGQRLGRHQYGRFDIRRIRRPGQLPDRKPEPVGRGQNHALAGDFDADAGQHRQSVIAAGSHRHLPDRFGEQVGGNDTRLVGQGWQRRIVLDSHRRQGEFRTTAVEQDPCALDADVHRFGRQRPGDI